MKPQKFIESYKCDCFQPENYCNCPHKIISSDVLLENVSDIAKSLVEVMNLCGIYMSKAKSSSDVVIYYFLHFEEIIHRIDSIPRKRLNKEDLLHDLSRKCDMDRREAQIAYSIIKRAFKAFYHGTDMGGVPNSLLSDKLTHTSECLWVHAAQLTAQLCASYEGLFYACQKDLECKIKLIYRNLYERITHRTQRTDDNECSCIKCLKRIAKETLPSVKVTTGMHDVQNPYETVYLKEQEELELMSEMFNREENKGKSHCSCSSLKITKKDYDYREMAKSINRATNQWPFQCRWFPISKEEFEMDESVVNAKLPEEFSCSSCRTDNECNDDCICTCEECICKSDDDIYCDELWNENNLEENFSNENSTLSLQNVVMSDVDFQYKET